MVSIIITTISFIILPVLLTLIVSLTPSSMLILPLLLLPTLLLLPPKLSALLLVRSGPGRVAIYCSSPILGHA